MAVFDFKNPDYTGVIHWRAETLAKFKKDPKLLAASKLHYKHHPWDFITDWGMTFDPRNIEIGRQPAVPFVLWPKQLEYLQWVHARWLGQERGLAEKSRDCGVTCLSAAYAASMFLFWDGYTAGFGSRKEELVDKIGDPKTIFHKVRYFLETIPAIFLPEDWDPKKHCNYMRIVNPANGATITGEAGDDIGRGGRTSVYFVDETAAIEHQQEVDNALSQNTNCQIDISTPRGSGNLFYQKRQKFNNTQQLFVFDWRDDPRKDEAWYQRQLRNHDAVTVAQEVDRDYNASQEDSFIPAAWVKACIDAHLKLGFHAAGVRVSSFDPADTGDAKALVQRYGSIITDADQKVSEDITQAAPWAIATADQWRSDVFIYDADGMGAPSMKLALERFPSLKMEVLPYHGSAGVQDNDLHKKRTGKEFRAGKDLLRSDFEKAATDMFANFRAQTWYWLRVRFELTAEAMERALTGQVVYMDPGYFISIDSKCTKLNELVSELSRPKRKYTPNGKILVESKKDMKKRGIESPNLADAAVMAFSVTAIPMAMAKKKAPRQTVEYESYGPAVQGVM